MSPWENLSSEICDQVKLLLRPAAEASYSLLGIAYRYNNNKDTDQTGQMQTD